MEALPLELVILISSSDPIAFTLMVQVSRQVYEYTRTTTGRNLFLATCAITTVDDDTSSTLSTITMHRHSFYDQPSLISKRYQVWYKHNKRHRINGPAVIYARGGVGWWINNKLHKTDGPVAICERDHQFWYHTGKLHRDDGPAVMHANGDCEWYQHGKVHRTDGPAITFVNGRMEWWINGVKQSAPVN